MATGKKTAETPKPTQLNLVGGKKVLPRPNLTNRRPKLNYRLGSQTEDFISSRLQNQIDDFRQWYISRKLAEKTFNNHLITLKQFFGWLIRYELASQWQPLQGDEKAARFKAILDSFCFESMIPFFPLPKRSRFTTRSEYIEAKEDAKDIRTEEAEETLKLFERFLDFYSATHSTRGNLIGMSVNVTKYLYKNQIDESNIETIPPILLKLKALRRVEEKGARNSPRAVPIEKKFIEYEEVLRVVVELKKLADQKKRTDNRPRVPSAIASAYSRFLMISFLSLLPPDRQQFIRELEIGTSFARGCFGRGDIFIPEAQMSDPSQAGWCINLTKYKTHKTYGDCKITLPNYSFGDGTNLYDYVDLWLNHYRALFKPKGNWLFVRRYEGDKWTNESVHGMVVTVFHRRALKPVNPHMLRHIFNTHLEESHAPITVKSASRKFMKQSDKVAESSYSHAITDRAVAPAITYMKGMITEAFQNSFDLPSKNE